MKKKTKTAVKKAPKKKAFTLSCTLKDLLEAGCHFGHLTAKTHPRIRPYLYMAKDKVQVFDLIKTEKRLYKACLFLHQIASSGKPIVFVGTKRQARKIIQESAKEADVAFVIERWLGGTITNWREISKRIKKLAGLKKDWEEGKFTKRPKKEQALIKKEIYRLERFFGGISDLKELPAAVFVADVNRERSVVLEARRAKIPLVAIVDSNADPTLIDYPIPANDDALKSIKLLVSEITRAIKLGKKTVVKQKSA